MSVLIEYLTLVVPKRVLALRYPGGIQAFLQATRKLSRPPRFVCCTDPHLVNLSFYGPKHLEPCIVLLEEQGLTGVKADRFTDFACVDPRHGPSMPCEWLEWAQDSEGYTYAWLAGTEPGDVAADKDWTPERSRDLGGLEVCRAPERMLRLAEEDGVEVWLDFQTGLQAQWPAARRRTGPAGLDVGPGPESHPFVEGQNGSAGAKEKAADPPQALDESLFRKLVKASLSGQRSAAPARESDRGALSDPFIPSRPLTAGLRRFARDSLRKAGLDCEIPDHHQWICVPFGGEHAEYAVRIMVQGGQRALVLHCTVPVRVPGGRRAQIAKALARINQSLPVGRFDLDVFDGVMRYRSGFALEDGEKGGEMLVRRVEDAHATVDRFFPVLMRIIYGGLSPEEALGAV